MTRRKIVEWPHPSLLTPAQPVTDFGPSLQQLVADMHETMTAASGIGLAANQIDVLQRVVVVQIPFSGDDGAQRQPWHDQKLTFINPRLCESRGKQRYLEGCLSFPDLYDWVERASEIVIEAEDVAGKTFRQQADGVLAVCLLHEMDHLDGVVFYERMSRLKASNIKHKMTQRAQLRSGG